MHYTERTIFVSKSRVVEAERRVARQRKAVEQLQTVNEPADDAVALLMVMEQSLLSMKRFLSIVERELELSLAIDAPGMKARARKADRAS
jgi:hypothetical protein